MTRAALGLMLIVAMLMAATSIPMHSFALKNFFNCMTRIANSHHALTVDDVNNCYAKEFKNPPG